MRIVPRMVCKLCKKLKCIKCFDVEARPGSRETPEMVCKVCKANDEEHLHITPYHFPVVCWKCGSAQTFQKGAAKDTFQCDGCAAVVSRQFLWMMQGVGVPVEGEDSVDMSQMQKFKAMCFDPGCARSGAEFVLPGRAKHYRCKRKGCAYRVRKDMFPLFEWRCRRFAKMVKKYTA